MSEKQIYIVLKRNNDRVVDYALSTTEIDQIWIDERFKSNKETEDESATQTDDESKEGKENGDVPPYPLTFGDVEEAFAQAMLMYRKSVVETISLAPILAKAYPLGAGCPRCSRSGLRSA
ncbi:hypothetical protein [Marivita sp.]|uniref:hypothetical protein n=1 Tax=Marivita sp. TaxID=2003365 RepID=UPI003B5B2703